MTTSLKSKPLPAWSKALITFVAFGMLAAFSGVILVTAVLKQQFDLSSNPKAIAQLARTMILLPDPLPEGYTYFLGMDLALLKTVTIDYENGKQRLVFFSCPTSEKIDAKEMLAQTFEQGLGTITGDAGSKFSSVLSEGAWVIRDTQIPYRIGRLEGEKGGTGLVACILDDDQKRALIIYAIQPKGETFDTKPCTTLLENVDAAPTPVRIPAASN